MYASVPPVSSQRHKLAKCRLETGDSLLELALATLLRPIVQQGQYGIGAAAQNIVSKASLQPLQHQLCTPTERMELIRLQCVGIA